MKGNCQRLFVCFGLAAGAIVLYGRTNLAPPARRTGAQVDGGLDCTACHRTYAPANSDPRGKVTISTSSTYKPGVKQTVKVRVEHPEAQRWGFQLTARPVNDETKMAGSFTVDGMVRVTCDGDTPAPCGGNLEFASHTTEATFRGQRNAGEWDVEWTPPANEVGEIVLYAAGNAADNNGNNQNDYIYTTSLRIKAEGACNLTRKPTVRTFANGGSFGNTLAMNTLGSVFGLDFQVAGNTRTAGKGDFVDGAFPKELACVAVEIDGRRAPVTYVQTDQLNFQVPTTTTLGQVQARVIVNPGKPNEIRSDVATITLTSYAPALFTLNGKSIAALTTDYKVVADPSVSPGGVFAKPGDVVLLYATGFAATEPVFQAGELAEGLARLRDPFTITIGGTTLAASDIIYAGLAPGSISGLYQFNVRIPQSAPDGDVPVTITTGGLSTQNGATIPVKR